jgi:hypothetical protein
LQRSEVDQLDPGRTWWVPAVVSPERNWAGAPGCRRGARYLVDPATLGATRDDFRPFETELICLHWIMKNRSGLNRCLPGASIKAVRLDRWLLGLD